MKKLTLVLAIALAFTACKNERNAVENTQDNVKKEMAYASFGEAINAEHALTSEHMMSKYKTLKSGDTITTKMTGKISDVCSKKGCWMTLDMGNDQSVMVRFKDYGFFMPLNATGNVVVNGKAFITETSVEELRHYAEDAGKSQAEIDAITSPKLEYRFLADGVLLEQ